eukprot:8203902-Prorocentrum_lima.AAC.1
MGNCGNGQARTKEGVGLINRCHQSQRSSRGGHGPFLETLKAGHDQLDVVVAGGTGSDREVLGLAKARRPQYQ